MPLNEFQKSKIEKVFLSFNEDGTGVLSFNEFYNFLQTAFQTETTINTKWTTSLTKDLAFFIFSGAASECSSSVDFLEVIPIIEAILDDDIDFLIRFTYKAMDPLREGAINIQAIPKAASLFGFPNSEEIIFQKVHQQFGNDKELLTYSEFYQLLTDVPKENAPLPSARKTPEDTPSNPVQKSACCLLI